MASRGGRRSGTPGKAYGQRSDMNVPTASPSSSPSPTPVYGAAAALDRAQAALPSGAPPAPPQGAAPYTGPLPGQLTPLNAPSDRPNEPLTHGLPTGPGGGPEVLNQGQGYEQMRQWLPYLEWAASRPDTPQEVVNLFTFLRGQ